MDGNILVDSVEENGIELIFMQPGNSQQYAYVECLIAPSDMISLDYK